MRHVSLLPLTPSLTLSLYTPSPSALPVYIPLASSPPFTRFRPSPHHLHLPLSVYPSTPLFTPPPLMSALDANRACPFSPFLPAQHRPFPAHHHRMVSPLPGPLHMMYLIPLSRPTALTPHLSPDPNTSLSGIPRPTPRPIRPIHVYHLRSIRSILQITFSSDTGVPAGGSFG